MRLLLALFLSGILSAAAASARGSPTAYSVTEVDAMFGAAHTVMVQRDGDRATVELRPLSGSGPRVRTFYDSKASRSYAWDATAANPPCKAGTFVGNWGDAFDMSSGLTAGLSKRHPKELGKGTVAGMPVRVVEADGSKGQKVHLSITGSGTGSGLVLKLETMAPSGPQRLFEVSSIELAPPPPSAFDLPPECQKLVGVPPPAGQ